MAKDPEAVRGKPKGLKGQRDKAGGGIGAAAKKKATPKKAEGLSGKKRRANEEEDYSAGDEGMGNYSDDGGDSPPPEAASGNGKKSAKLGPKGEANSFGEAMRTALARHVPTTAPTPILAGIKKNKEIEKERKDSKKEKKEAKLVEAKKKWYAKERIIPDHADGNFEKVLMKIATKGTVQLFNAVQKQQKARNEEKGTAPAGKAIDNVSKNEFLDMLKGGKVAEVKTKKTGAWEDEDEEDEDEEGGEGGVGGGDDGEGSNDDDEDEEGDFEGSDSDGEEGEGDDGDEVEFGDWGDEEEEKEGEDEEEEEEEGESEEELEEDRCAKETNPLQESHTTLTILSKSQSLIFNTKLPCCGPRGLGPLLPKICTLPDALDPNSKNLEADLKPNLVQ